MMEPQQDTVAALRSRVDQQSTLIAMLKQRGDTTLSELTESQSKYELLVAQVASLQDRLTQEELQYKQLEKRFSILAKNHEEMIRIKDEYKQANIDLQAKNKAYLSHKCEQCTALEKELAHSNTALTNSKSEHGAQSKECAELQARVKSLENELVTQTKSAHEQKQHLTQKLNNSEQKLGRLEIHCKSKEEHNQKLQISIRQLEAEKEKITKELTTYQGLLSKCEQDLKASKDREQTLQESFKSRCDEVSKDACVKKLTQQLLEAEEKLLATEKDYTAYKKHSSQLLAHERELNNKLRHILD